MTLTSSLQQNAAFGNSEEIASSAGVDAIDPRLIGLPYMHLDNNQMTTIAIQHPVHKQPFNGLWSGPTWY